MSRSVTISLFCDPNRSFKRPGPIDVTHWFVTSFSHFVTPFVTSFFWKCRAYPIEVKSNLFLVTRVTPFSHTHPPIAGVRAFRRARECVRPCARGLCVFLR